MEQDLFVEAFDSSFGGEEEFDANAPAPSLPLWPTTTFLQHLVHLEFFRGALGLPLGEHLGFQLVVFFRKSARSER
jgi:hypothetical protein